VCGFCRALMTDRGLEPADPSARRRFAQQTHNEFVLDMSRFVRELGGHCPVYYNHKNIGPGNMAAAGGFTHFEFDALPGDPAVGYLRGPALVRYFRNFGKDCLGHTGRFHTTWGDVHSLKNRAALEYECFHMLALGAGCVIGDQLHPSGQLDRAAYDLIGAVYGDVETKEPWCVAATPLAEVAVLSPDEFTHGEVALRSPAAYGATRMLQEGAQQFDVVDSAADFSKYRVIVLPDNVPVSGGLAAKFDEYLAAGGGVIASFESGLDVERTDFALKALGVRLSPTPTRDLDGRLVRGRPFPNNDYADYLLPRDEIGQGLPQTEHVMYVRGTEVAAAAGTDVLADGVLPYFDRTYRHFCSHRQTPSSGRVGHPAVTRRGRAVYFAHPIFTMYDQSAPRWCRALFLNALAMLLPEPLVRHDGPSTVIATLTSQDSAGRWVVHLLHYVPVRRGRAMDVVEDVLPLHELGASVRVPSPVESVSLVPSGEDLPFELRGGRVEFVVPKIVGHQMVALGFDRREER
jgi:hypothetical protein